jgi:hypothetical protein
MSAALLDTGLESPSSQDDLHTKSPAPEAPQSRIDAEKERIAAKLAYAKQRMKELDELLKNFDTTSVLRPN